MVDKAHFLGLPQKKHLKASIFLFGIYCPLIILSFLCGCSKRPTQGQQAGADRQMPVPVLTAKVEQKTTPIELESFGTVEAYASVDVKAQITGILTDVKFAEGQMVKKGDLLLLIDPRQQQAVLDSARANLERDQAQLKNAEKEADRQTELLQKGIVAPDEYDQSITAAETLRAAIKADKATVDNASLQLEYCSIRSPIDGCIGILNIHKGNLVRANDTTVVCIKQIDPIYVSFWVPEQYLPDIQKYMAVDKLDVTVTQPYEEREPIPGYLTFVDNTVDASTNTRTIRLRATFSNKNQDLWPGQFVKVVLALTKEPNSIVVPSQAVQISQDGQYVFVVKPDQTVEARPVTVKRTMNNETVVEGLKPGEEVVTDGHLRLVPGTKIEKKNSVKNEAVNR